MKARPFENCLCLLASLCLFTSCTTPGLRAPDTGPAVAKPEVNVPVTVTDNGRTWTLDNGIVKATINKDQWHMSSLLYHGLETQGGGGYWEETPQGAPRIDPGRQPLTPPRMAAPAPQVAVKGVTGGTVMLTPSAPGGGTYCNIEVRYALGRGESGIYAYAIFSPSPPNYGAMGVGESRYITKLNKPSNWISVDADRNMLECTPRIRGTGIVIHAKEQRILSTGLLTKNSVEHKYIVTPPSSPEKNPRLRLVQHHKTTSASGSSIPPSNISSGGASKQELVCHLDANDNPGPHHYDYWRGTHYGGGASCNISAGEDWSKVIGPIFVYCNALAKPQAASAVRPRHPRRDRRQSHRAGRLEGKRHRPLAGCS